MELLEFAHCLARAGATACFISRLSSWLREQIPSLVHPWVHVSSCARGVHRTGRLRSAAAVRRSICIESSASTLIGGLDYVLALWTQRSLYRYARQDGATLHPNRLHRATIRAEQAAITARSQYSHVRARQNGHCASSSSLLTCLHSDDEETIRLCASDQLGAEVHMYWCLSSLSRNGLASLSPRWDESLRRMVCACETSHHAKLS